MASDFNSIAKAIRYLGDCVRYLADKYVAVNDRVYSDWNEASKVVGDVGRDHVADYAEASHKQGKVAYLASQSPDGTRGTIVHAVEGFSC